VKAHEADLRVEVEKHLGEQGDSGVTAVKKAASFAADLAAQGSEAAADPRLRVLLRYAERLAVEPASCNSSHVEDLRQQGYSDKAIHDTAQVIAYFSYINRIADGLGVDLEPEMQS
jgi:uncharacterized peroxidase-related enzyme